MGLKDMLINQGSPYSYGDGSTPPTNKLATPQSKMHADGSNPGYSLNGSKFNQVNNAFQQYNDGVGNTLPMPSQLDMNGATPPTYSNNGPLEGHY